MRMRHRINWLDRRRFLVGSAAALAGGTSVARAQIAPPKESPRLSARIAEVAVGLELAKAPPLAIERAVIPALLPLAEATGATPAEVLAAFIVGFEVCSRLSRANPTHNGAGSWHGTSTIGAISAAVSCARLMKLSAAAYPDVIGIAVSMASGVNPNYATTPHPLHPAPPPPNALPPPI